MVAAGADRGDKAQHGGLDSDVLSGQRWGRLDLASAGHIALDGTLTLQEGGQLALTGSQVGFGGTVQIAGGQVEAGNLLPVLGRPTALLSGDRAGVEVAAGARIDLAGGWSNALLHRCTGNEGVDRWRTGALRWQS